METDSAFLFSFRVCDDAVNPVTRYVAKGLTVPFHHLYLYFHTRGSSLLSDGFSPLGDGSISHRKLQP